MASETTKSLESWFWSLLAHPSAARTYYKFDNDVDSGERAFLCSKTEKVLATFTNRNT